MTQNIYDNEEFFAGYSRLRRSVKGLEGAPEWPALQALFPDLHEFSVLDLGCGFGWFCRFAREAGAAHVLGIEISEKMLARGRATTDDLAITYTRADMEHLELCPESFNLIYSSLALHYVENLGGLMSQVYQALVPGGNLIFSVEHPIYTAPSDPRWFVDAEGHKTWPIDGYLEEGPRSTDWLAKGVIKQHRTLGTYVNLLISLGFTISHIEDWGPTKEQVMERPDLADERERPAFLLIAARK